MWPFKHKHKPLFGLSKPEKIITILYTIAPFHYGSHEEWTQEHVCEDCNLVYVERIKIDNFSKTIGINEALENTKKGNKKC